LEPKLMFDLQQGEGDAVLREYLVKPLHSMAYFVPCLIGPAVLLLPGAVAWLLPRYVVGVPAAQILLAGGYFLALSYILRGIIVAKGVQLAAALVTFAVTAVNLVLGVLLLKLGLGLAGVALASAVSFFLLFIVQLHLVKKCLARVDLVSLPVLCLPFLVAGGGGVALLWLAPRLPLPLLCSEGLGVLLYGLLCWWLYNRAADRYGHFSRLVLPWRKPRT
jgi:O-antigen/teichoic acid export membrane protein